MKKKIMSYILTPEEVLTLSEMTLLCVSYGNRLEETIFTGYRVVLREEILVVYSQSRGSH